LITQAQIKINDQPVQVAHRSHDFCVVPLSVRFVFSARRKQITAVKTKRTTTVQQQTQSTTLIVKPKQKQQQKHITKIQMVNREFKLVVLGAGAVGKSCMTVQLVSHQFIDFYDPTIEDSYRKQTVIDGETVQLDILDTAGQDEYSAMRDQYMRTGQGFVLVFDMTNRATFDALAIFAEQVSRVKDAAITDVPMIVVGNKCDLEHQRTVSPMEARAFAESIGARYGECSAFLRFNIDEVFADAVREVKRRDGEMGNGSTVDVQQQRKALPQQQNV
jgi:GTPase KRas protein